MNPMMLIQMFMGGANPMQVARNLAAQDGRFAPALKMVEGKNEGQLRSTFYNACQSMGVSPEQVAKSAGISLPK